MRDYSPAFLPDKRVANAPPMQRRLIVHVDWEMRFTAASFAADAVSNEGRCTCSDTGDAERLAG
jgi:hypothetical protein